MAKPGDPAQRGTLKADGGVHVIGPGNGDQACGEIGDGRMLEPAEIMAALDARAQPKTLLGKRVLITAGPTQEAVTRCGNHQPFQWQDGLRPRAATCAEAGAGSCWWGRRRRLPTSPAVPEQKIKKSDAGLNIHLEPTVDILAAIAAHAAAATIHARKNGTPPSLRRETSSNTAPRARNPLMPITERVERMK